MNKLLLNATIWANLRSIMSESMQPKKEHSTIIFLLYKAPEQGVLIYSDRKQDNYCLYGDT